jgi:hypothetical protein
MNRTTTRIIASVLAITLWSNHPAEGEDAPEMAIIRPEVQTVFVNYPDRKLRGYGTVSGSFESKAAGSILRITCEDAEKAKLMQAKYLSDLECLPGVTRRAGHEQAPTLFVVESQGCVAAFASGKTVLILAAASDKDTQTLIRQAKTSGPSTAQVEVPMYLDRWDRFGFRHYYWAWQLPKGANTSAYDFTAEFDYAKAQDRAGILLDVRPLATDSADGLISSGYNRWVEDEAGKRKLPVEIHLAANASTEPTWLLNRFREQTQLKAPGFTGNFHSLMSPYLGGQGVLSWNATTGEDSRLALLQETVRRTATAPNVVSYLEPHGETRHGAQDIFLEYGPVANAAYRRYLQEKYATPAVVAARWGSPVKSWEDIRVPELAAFAGWGPQALDIGGVWKVGYEELTEPAKPPYFYDREGTPKSTPAPKEWFEAGFADADWPTVPGAGHDKQLFLAKRPAVFRRTFDLPAAWRTRNDRVWLYLWDLNLASNQEVRVALNGHELGRDRVTRTVPHWCALEATETVKSGANTLAIRVPQGHISYKTYLSPVEPKQYPDLGEGLNAQWVDFIDFTAWSRMQTIKRGMEMIRQAAPSHPITMMHPDDYADGLKSLAEAYGGDFHNTGYMAAFFADFNNSLMRGADLPYSLEPGGPAQNLTEWKRFWGLWQMEGVQSVDYFIHLGNILWNPEIKADYEAHRKQFTLMGQSHYAKAEIACLYSTRIDQLTGYPWGSTPNTLLAGGYWNWNAGAVLRGCFPYDGLSQSSFASGDADAYRVIIDANTSIMDETQVTEIERWIKAGGTFITLAQTGRHTPERPDTWPIARLTGYRVTRIHQLRADGKVDEQGILQSAPGQTVFAATWDGIAANGLHLERAAPDVQDLLLWKDGGVAASSRRLGKGVIVQLGAKFTGAKMSDRVEPGGDSPEAKRLRDLLSALLDWRGIARETGRLMADTGQVWLRPAVTNNGLYDTWTVFNWSKDQNQTVSIGLGKERTPAFAIEARDGKRIAVTSTPDGGVLKDIVLEPLETRVFLTPRGQINQAPVAWFDLQRKWWRGTTKPAAKSLTQGSRKLACELTAGWRFKSLDDTADATPLLAAVVAVDSTWPVQLLGIWNSKETGGRGHGVFRKTFSVPAEWTDGRVSLWMTSWSSSSFVEKGRVWLDGQEVKPLNSGAYIAEGLPALQAGSSHTLAVEVQSSGVLAGLRGQCWLSFEPAPAPRLDLAGSWTPSVDGLRYDEPITLPGSFDAQFLRRTVVIDAAQRGKNVMLTVEGDRALIGVLINGTLVRHHHHMIGERWSLNLTPFVRFGANNEIELMRWDKSGSGAVREIGLGFYDPDMYP